MSLEVETPQRSRFFRRGFRGLLNRRNILDGTQVAGELATSPLLVMPPAHAMFQEARNTRIRNATFNIYGAEPGAPPPPDRNDIQASPPTPPASVEDRSLPTSSLSNSRSSVVADDAFPTPQSSPEIYVRSLMGRNRGYPLWIPSANMLLPVCYRASGVKIGDVGIITPEGGFSFFFNVCHEATHPINASRRLPVDFVPFATSPSDCDIEEFKEYSAGTYCSDDSVNRMDSGDERFKTVLQTSAMHAGVLMMPEPVYVSKLQTLALLRKYVHANLKSWYQFVKIILGRDVDNGELRVVYGCRKSTAFGIATVNNGTTNLVTELTFSVDDSWAAVTGCKYRWHHRGSAETKAGPSLDEKQDIIAFNANTCDPINQCLFMSTIDIKLSEDEWQQIDNSAAVCVTNQSPDIQTVSASLTAPPPSGRGDHRAKDDSMGPDYGDRTRSVPLVTEANSVAPLNEQKPFHPSDVLTDYLLWAAPDATAVAICTDDWGPYMLDSIKSVSAFVNVVLSENDVYENNGMIYLDRRVDDPHPVSRVNAQEVSSRHEPIQYEPDRPVEYDIWHTPDATRVQKVTNIETSLEMEGKVIRNDPSTSLARIHDARTKQAPALPFDIDSEEAFPSLVPSAASANALATSAWGDGPRRKGLKVAIPSHKVAIPKNPVFTESFTLGEIDLSRSGKDGKLATLGEVIKQVIAKYKVKVEASSNQRARQTTFRLKAESQKDLDKAKCSLLALVSPIVTLIVNAPASAIGSIIGPKGATLKQIREQTSVRVDIPKIDGRTEDATVEGDAAQDDGKEITIPITLVGPLPLAHEAQELLKQIIASKTSQATQRVRIPTLILPFFLRHRARFLGAAPEGAVTLSLNTPESEMSASGDREAVASVVELMKQVIQQLCSSISCIKISLPKHQHRLLTDSNADTILAKSDCAVVVGKPEEAGDEVTIWGAPVDLHKGLSAVLQQANSEHIYEYTLPSPASLSRQLATYLHHVNYAQTLKTTHPDVDVYLPSLEAATYSVNLVGAKADVYAVVEQISDLLGRVIGGTKDVSVNWLIHRVITGKNARRLKQFHDVHNVNVYFPPESAESSTVLLVYDPLGPNASFIRHEKKKHLDEVEKEMLMWARDAADVKTEKIFIEKRWHDVVFGNGNGGTTLNDIIGEDSGLFIKAGAEASGDATTEDIIHVHGVREDVDRAVKHILKVVEDAKKDEILNSFSTEFDIDQDYTGRIVGFQGAAVEKLRRQLGVRVDVSDGADEEKEGGKKKTVNVKSKVKITGREKDVKEAKSRILYQIDILADETQEVVKIPAHYLASLIEQIGNYGIRLEERYSVRIRFPRHFPQGGEDKTYEQLKPNEVLVKGGRKDVALAKAEMRQVAMYAKDDNNTSFPFAISEQGTEYTSATLKIEHRFHRTIIGRGGQGLKDLIARCGGPSDPVLLSSIIQFPRHGDLSEEVHIRGEPNLVQKIKDELESILIILRNYVILGVEIPNSDHGVLIGRGGQHLNELQDRFHVRIHFPDSHLYNEIGEPENADELGTVDARDLVKVSGPRAGCEQAIGYLESNIKPAAPSKEFKLRRSSISSDSDFSLY